MNCKISGPRGSVGDCVGTDVGDPTGCRVGYLVGKVDGCPVGESDGCEDGNAVATYDGSPVGKFVTNTAPTPSENRFAVNAGTSTAIADDRAPSDRPFVCKAAVKAPDEIDATS